jgi:hypothetical protein
VNTEYNHIMAQHTSCSLEPIWSLSLQGVTQGKSECEELLSSALAVQQNLNNDHSTSGTVCTSDLGLTSHLAMTDEMQLPTTRPPRSVSLRKFITSSHAGVLLRSLQRQLNCHDPR